MNAGNWKATLHDAIVESINVNWADREVVINLKAFSEQGENAISYILKFEHVKGVQIPHESPWGESESINSISVEDETCKIEMQSGDVVQVSESRFRFD